MRLDVKPYHKCRVGCDGRDASAIIREFRSRWRDERGDTMPAWLINCGDCHDFAESVTEVMVDHGVHGVLIVDTDWFCRPSAHDFHAWIFYAGKHYDAEVPEGVADWMKLPFFGRPEGRGEAVIRADAVTESRALILAVQMMKRCRAQLLMERGRDNAMREAGEDLVDYEESGVPENDEGEHERDRETWPQRPVSVRIGEEVEELLRQEVAVDPRTPGLQGRQDLSGR